LILSKPQISLIKRNTIYIDNKPLRILSWLSDVDGWRLLDGVDGPLSLLAGCSELVRDNEYRRIFSTLLNDGDEAVVVLDVIDRLLIGIFWLVDGCRFGPDTNAARPWIKKDWQSIKNHFKIKPY
jgi:hypothetical protein